jgi:hypothetical protein
MSGSESVKMRITWPIVLERKGIGNRMSLSVISILYRGIVLPHVTTTINIAKVQMINQVRSWPRDSGTKVLG